MMCENCFEEIDKDSAPYIVEAPHGRHKPNLWNLCSRKCVVAVVKKEKKQIREHADYLLSLVKVRKTR